MFLIDTQVLVWTAKGDPRLSAPAATAMFDSGTALAVSAVTAYEFADLNGRGRFGVDLPLRPLLDRLEAEVLGYPPQCWTLIASMPPIHRDPIDRMLVAHALFANLTIVTADRDMHAYPVRTLW